LNATGSVRFTDPTTGAVESGTLSSCGGFSGVNLYPGASNHADVEAFVCAEIPRKLPLSSSPTATVALLIFIDECPENLFAGAQTNGDFRTCNKTDIIGDTPLTSESPNERYFIAERTRIAMFDPVPLDGVGSLLDGIAISTSRKTLSSPSARRIAGIAADGVAQMVIQVEAEPGALIVVRVQRCNGTATVQNCSDATSNRDYGGIFNPLNPPSAASLYSTDVGALPSFLGVLAQDPDEQSGPLRSLAIFAYRAPLALPEPRAAESALFLRVDIPAAGGAVTLFQRVAVKRRPLMFTSGASFHWLQVFHNLPEGWSINEVSLDDEATLLDTAGTVFGQVRRNLSDYRRTKLIAAAQTDYVALSRFGVIVRAMHLHAANVDPAEFGRGPIHKLITLGSPHFGSEAIPFIQGSGNVCRAVLETKFMRGPDMIPNSAFLRTLNSRNRSLPVFAVAGVLTSTQSEAFELKYLLASSGSVLDFCPSLPPGGLAGLFGGANDGAVSLLSARAGRLGSTGAVSLIGRAHTVSVTTPDLFGDDGTGFENSKDNGVLSDIIRSLIDTPIHLWQTL